MHDNGHRTRPPGSPAPAPHRQLPARGPFAPLPCNAPASKAAGMKTSEASPPRPSLEVPTLEVPTRQLAGATLAALLVCLCGAANQCALAAPPALGGAQADGALPRRRLGDAAKPQAPAGGGEACGEARGGVGRDLDDAGRQPHPPRPHALREEAAQALHALRKRRALRRGAVQAVLRARGVGGRRRSACDAPPRGPGCVAAGPGAVERRAGRAAAATAMPVGGEPGAPSRLAGRRVRRHRRAASRLGLRHQPRRARVRPAHRRLRALRGEGRWPAATHARGFPPRRRRAGRGGARGAGARAPARALSGAGVSLHPLLLHVRRAASWRVRAA